MLRLECQPHPDHLQWVGAEDGCDTSETSRDQSSEWRLLVWRWNDHRPDLLVGEELDGSVGKYSYQCRRVTLKQASDAFAPLDVLQSQSKPRPTPGILSELGVRCLEENLDAIQRRDDGFCLPRGIRQIILSLPIFVFKKITVPHTRQCRRQIRFEQHTQNFVC